MPIESKRVVAILLAAGRAERFGRDKLAEPFAGAPLAHHAARALSDIDFARRIVVVGPTSVDFSGFAFDIVRPLPGSPMSMSIIAGARAARAIDCDACLIALADMPMIPTHHFRALLQAHETDVTATLASGRKMVPALFGRTIFDSLCALTGDQGAAALLADAGSVPAEDAAVADIDVPSDLAVSGHPLAQGRHDDP